jgi:aspartate/methionine/tyrosine aminotransferase
MGLVRYLGGDVDEMCHSLLDEAGVLLLPGTVYDTGSGIDLGDHFRIGFGCRGLDAGIDAMADYFDRHA